LLEGHAPAPPANLKRTIAELGRKQPVDGLGIAAGRDDNAGRQSDRRRLIETKLLAWVPLG
jgi:hypothetical protein